MPHILALHGFTGRGLDFEELARNSGNREAWSCPDLPGHGPKPAGDCSPNGMLRFIDSMTAGLERDAAEGRKLVGYSMGARAALLHATTNPGTWDRLILISPNPGISGSAERAQRAQSDESLALRIEREGVPAFLEFWRAQPLIRNQQNIPHPRRRALRAARLGHTADGLAAALRSFGQGVCPDLWPRLSAIRCPVVLVHGTEDTRYTDISKNMETALASAIRVPVQGVGHAPHIEAPQTLARLLYRHLG